MSHKPATETFCDMNITCSNCSQPFNTKPCTQQTKGKIPLVLFCGHSMCEACIRNILEFGEPLDCKICGQDSAIKPTDIALLSQKKIKLTELFPMNYYILGEILAHQIENVGVISDNIEDDYFIDIKTIINSSETLQGQCIECSKGTNKMCQNCANALCETCFARSHKNFVVFKNHILQNIETANTSINCKKHKNKPLEYYCKDCDKTICVDCLMICGEDSCKGHTVESVDVINEKFRNDLCNMGPKLDENLKRLSKTAVDVGYLLQDINNDSSLKSNINQAMTLADNHFSKLLARIQNCKQQITQKLLELKHSEKDSLLKIRSDLTDTLKKTIKMLNIITSLSEPEKSEKINISALYEEAKDLVNIPWYLNKNSSSDKEPIIVKCNDSLEDVIKNYVELEINSEFVYSLKREDELEEGTVVPPAPQLVVFPPKIVKDVRNKNKPKQESKTMSALCEEVPKFRSKHGSNGSLNSIGSDHSNNPFQDAISKHSEPSMSPIMESQFATPLSEGDKELVFISHIVDPHNFFVQRASHQKLLKELVQLARNAISYPKPSLKHVAEGNVYLVFNRADNMWQRGRVISIEKSDEKSSIFNMFCIDFGSTESVTLEKLRVLPPGRMHSPSPLALNCRLANCEPRAGKWTSEDALLIQKIVDNKQAVMYIRRLGKSPHYISVECDLTSLEDGVNIAKALVFHERAKLINPRLQYPNITGIVEKPKLILSNNYKPKTFYNVSITHVVSPDQFYVRMVDNEEMYQKLCEDLEIEYTGSDSGFIYLPEPGMACVVNASRCGSALGELQWARGVVSEPVGRGRVRLSLPDVGAAPVAHWTALRHMQLRFARQHALATECHLSGITPTSKHWSSNSVFLLQKLQGRCLTMFVEEARYNGSVGIILYANKDQDDEICVNSEMIRYKYAISFGINKFKERTNVQEKVIISKSPLDRPPPRPKINKITIQKPNHNQKPREKPSSDSDKENKNLKPKDKGPIRLEVTLLNYQSPSLIYFRTVLQEQMYNELYDRLQNYYNENKSPHTNDWKVGDKCCAICKQSKSWRRGLIMELEDAQCKIFFYDFACVETVPLEHVRRLTKEFASVPEAAIKCHMAGIVPAIGEDWPIISKEHVKEKLDEYQRLFIAKVGDIKENKSLPVEIWVYHTTLGGALEPNISEWLSLNKQIVDQGLAIPDKSQAKDAQNKQDSEENNALSFLNLKGSLSEWLQLEPMPVKPLDIHKDADTENELDSDPNESTVEENENTVFISNWLPPEPLKNKEFTGFPTWVDDDGVIYLHDIEQQDTLKLIRDALDVRFNKPDPKSKFTKWTCGEPCVAMFYLDNKFYRGRIVDVNNDASVCKVHFIDYGNEEDCKFEDLRKTIALYKIPVQAHRCMLDRIKPVDQHWDRTTLDYIHKFIVEKHCLIKMTGESVDDIIPIELKYDKFWLNDHLVDLELAVFIDGSKAVVPKFAPVTVDVKENNENESECDSGPDYIVEEENSLVGSSDLETMKNKDWNQWMEEEKLLEKKFITFKKHKEDNFLCTVCTINDLNLLELTLVHNDEQELLYQSMYDEIQNEAEKLPPLLDVLEHKACIALYPEDKLWYRACILEYNETSNRVKVRYVDYGNIDVIDCKDAREITNEFCELLPASLTVKMAGVKVNPDIDIETISKKYAETFLNKSPFKAEVVGYEGSIPIVKLTNSNGESVYDELIESKVFLKICDK